MKTEVTVGITKSGLKFVMKFGPPPYNTVEFVAVKALGIQSSLDQKDSLGYIIKVDPESVAHVRNLYALPDHEVFELVPKDFAELAAEFYIQIGQPSGYALTMARDDHEDDIALLPNLTPLHNGSDVVGQDGSFYMGGVNNRFGLDEAQSSQLNNMMEQDEPLLVSDLTGMGFVFGEVAELKVAIAKWAKQP
ncbi:hypothetical protein B0H11DRAFT_1905887 [Mycena galericulata]|nr:hypothetical protein B0H11DRAFT_1905887 [Mycena galericulata]